MSETQVVKCIQRCYDGKRMRRYYPGDTDNIDPLEPVAQYFEGFAPGTVVYSKIRGSKVKVIVETTKTIPGGVAPKEEPEETLCPDCGKGPFKNMGAHKQHCRVD